MAALTLRPMTEPEFSAWRARSLAAYATDRARAQRRPREDVLPEATRQVEGYLSNGMHTDGHDFLRIVDDGEPVGWLWLGPHPDEAGAAWVYEIEVDEHAQGRGIGRAAMLAAEQVVASRGASELGLNVFGFNERAIALYRSLGYVTTSMNMAKTLGAGTD